MPDARRSQSSADRNLLFGILALQMDFITRDALVAAMNAWVIDKAKPLGQVLVQQQALGAEEHALLEALVRKHLERHGNDPEKSLAAVSSVGSVREDLKQIADSDVQASLMPLAAGPHDNDPFITRAPSVGQATSSGTRFRILRPHARGGLGQVSVALDGELNRQVALKEIQERYADDPGSRSRFLLEGEVTGGLEHPGIVPVYGLGQYADGRPYYAMRFIKGDSLKDAIERFHQADGPKRDPGERGLELRKLLGRFVDVCNAIAYAHSRGVLHRDLKPGNVMCGQYGETLVVDWGLAKPSGRADENQNTQEQPLQPATASGSAPTVMGSAIGTPQYMSPEQAAGRLDLLGPASDVYSLGATLYSLLTGKAPIDGQDAGAVIGKVQRGDFRPPGQVTRGVSRALEAICLKAMALKPEDRYASPRALADDIEHWLADEPVSAWREPWTVRARRWLGRHRTLVTAAAAAVLVAVVSLSSATLLLKAANTRERAAKELAEKNETEADDQRRQALDQKRRAEEEAAIARAVNEFLQKDLLGQADIRNQPLFGGAVQRNRNITVGELLDRAAKAIEGKFSEQPLTEGSIRLTLGNAYQALGRYPEAQPHLERSVELRRARLGADHPDTLNSKNNLAALYQDQGKYDQAEILCKEVLDASIARLGPDDPLTLKSKSNLAELCRLQGKYDQAEPLRREMLDASIAKLGADHPDTLTLKNNLASLYLDQGKHNRAERLFKEVLDIRTAKLAADHPDTLTSKNNLAMQYLAQRKYDQAEPLLKDVLDACSAKLGADHPDTLGTKNNLAGLYQDQGKYGRAEPLFKEVLDGLTAKLGADHPNTLKTKNNLAGVYYFQRKYDRAEPLFKDVLDATSAKLGADHPSTLQYKNNLAVLYDKQRKYDRAEPLYKEVLDGLTDKLGADHPNTQMTKNNLAGLYQDQGKHDRAEPLYRELADLCKHKAGADSPQYAEQLAVLGLNLLLQKKGTEAEEVLSPCLAVRQKYEPDAWTTFYTQSLLGAALLLQKKHAEAEPLLVQGYEGMKQREAKIPPQSKVRLTEALERLVQLYEAIARKDQADEWRKKLEEAKAAAKAPAKP